MESSVPFFGILVPPSVGHSQTRHKRSLSLEFIGNWTGQLILIDVATYNTTGFIHLSNPHT